MKKVRYAIYFSPKVKSPLWIFGAKWLGRTSKRLDVDGLSEKYIAEITKAPAHYGFHGTLKPPFALTKGCTFADLDKALKNFSEKQATITVPALQLTVLDDFLALVPKSKSQDINDLGAACVKYFDEFRAPPSNKELEKRKQANLSDHQQKMLDKWGYPYVMDEFKFHITLTDCLKPKNLDKTKQALSPYVTNITGKDLVINELTVFQQYSPNTAFEELKRYPFKTP